MRIKIKKKGNKTAILISFDTNTDKFKSRTERNRFFLKLHGRKQTIKKDKKRYEYYREGLLDEVPNIKVDNSVFIVAMKNMQKMMKFFNEWEDKVDFKTFPVLLEDKRFKLLQKEVDEDE